MGHRLTYTVLDRLKNSHLNKPIFLIGNGPSLNQVPDINVLGSRLTFAVNQFMSWDRVRFQPSYYGACEAFGLKELTIPAAAKAPKSMKFFAHEIDWTTSQRYEPLMTDWTWIYKHPNQSVVHDGIPGMDDDFWCTRKAHSVVFECSLPLALWMGCDPIYLLGCDNTPQGDMHIYDEPGAKDLYPDPPVDMARLEARREGTQQAAQRAYLDMKAAGRTLLDLTDGGHLPIPKGNLASVLELGQ